MAKINKVLYNIDQTGDTSSVEKKTARNNIGCPEIVTSTTALPPVETDVSKLLLKTDGRVYTDNTIIGNILPNPEQGDIGKFPVANWAGSPAIGTYNLTTINQVPASDATNAEQALIVNSSGTPEWTNILQVPVNGNNGQILTWNAGSPEWKYKYVWQPGYNMTSRANADDTYNPYIDCNYVVKNSYALINSADGQADGPDIIHETELACGIVFEIKYWSRSSTSDENMLTFRIKHKTGVNLVVSGNYTNYSASLPDNMSVYANVATANTYTDIIAHGLSDTAIFFANNPNSNTNVAETLKLKASWTNTKHYVQFSDIEIWRGIGGNARILYTYTTLTKTTGE